MNPREFSHRRLPGLVAWMDAFNQRHPWSHNDHFHGWILRRLPKRRRLALDVGCGRGELIDRLAPSFEQVTGADRDPGMRATAGRRVATHGNVSVTADSLADLSGGFDLITMVAVLHHLDAESAMAEVRRLLAPGGRLLVVGLARPETRLDMAWDVACLVSNPVIGLVKHPRVASRSDERPAYPTVEPAHTYHDVRELLGRHLPGARLRRREGFRYTAAWTRPA